MRLLVFLHGTVLMHAGGVGVTRAERVAQMRAKHPTSSSRTTAKHRCRPGHLPADIARVRDRIKSIIIPEFGGIDHLPDDPKPCRAAQPSRPHFSRNRSINAFASSSLMAASSPDRFPYSHCVMEDVGRHDK